MLALVLTALLGPAQAPLQEEPVELKVYSIASLTRSGFSDSAMSMFPLPWSQSAEDELGLESEPQAPLDPDEIVELLRMTVYPEIWDWHPETSIDYLDSDRILVRAPAGLHRELERRLKFLEQQFTTHARLVARVYQGSLAGSPPVNLSPIEADGRLAQALQGGSLTLQRQVSVPLSLASVRVAENMTVENMPFYWNIEIAQEAYIGDPEALVIGHGLRLEARPSPVPGGTMIDLLLRQSEKVAADRWMSPDTMAGLALDQQYMSTHRGLPDAAGTVIHPVTGFTSVAGTAFLPQGQALWIHTHARTASGDVPFLIDLRMEGELPSMTASQSVPYLGDPETREDDTTLELRTLHVGSLTHSMPSAPAVGPDTFDPQAHGSQWDLERCVAFLDSEECPPLIYIDSLADLMRCTTTWFDDDERAMMHVMEHSILYTVPPQGGERIQAPIQCFQASLQAFEVHGVVRRSGQAVAEFSAPLVMDRSMGVWSGVQTPGLFDWEVEVANNVSVAIPVFASVIDGYAINLHLSQPLQGPPELQIQGKLQFLHKPLEELALQVDGLPIHRILSDALFVDDVRSLGSEAPMKFGDDHLSLELTVTATR